MNTIDDSNIWKVTNHGRIMSEALRELAKQDFFKDKTILELGGGIANHTIMMLENDPRLLVTTEINEERMEFTRKVVRDRLGDIVNCEFMVADWLDARGSYDMVVTNPPYFMSGKYNRRYFIDELILNSHKRLKPGGYLIFVQSSMADIVLTRDRMEENGYRFELLHQGTFPWRDYYFSDPRFLEMCDNRPGSYFMKDGKRWEVLYVVLGQLKPFESKHVH